MNSQENNLTCNSQSFEGTQCQGAYSYRTLKSSGCFQPSPAICMSNYGQRSVMDNMNWVEYVANSQSNKKTFTAVPAASGNIKMTLPPFPFNGKH